MAVISNDRFNPGDTVTHTALNEKFTDVTTATTTALTGVNLRSEAVDLPNCDFAASDGESGIILVKARTKDNGVGNDAGASGTYVSTDEGVGLGATAQEISHGDGTRLTYLGGQTITDGDLLRVFFSLLCGDFTRVSLASARPCWVIWPQWDITSSALTDWEAIPGQVDFDTSFAGDAGLPKGAQAKDETAGTMVIPHGLHYYDDDADGNDDLDHEHMSAHRVQNYLHSGDDIKVYGIRLVIDGLYYPRYSSGGEDINRLAHKITDANAPNDKVAIKAACLTAILMRST